MTTGDIARDPGRLVLGLAGLPPVMLSMSAALHVVITHSWLWTGPLAFEVGVLEVTVVLAAALVLGLVLAIVGGSLAFIHERAPGAAVAWLGLALVVAVWWIAT